MNDLYKESSAPLTKSEEHQYTILHQVHQYIEYTTLHQAHQYIEYTTLHQVHQYIEYATLH